MTEREIAETPGMAPPKKLTAAQRQLLTELGQRAQSVVRGYRPAVALIERGLAEDLWPTDPYQAKLRITAAGQAALAETP